METITKRSLRYGVFLTLALVLFSNGTIAHHSKALQYDLTKKITIMGIISEMEWRNPHSWLSIEVENQSGRKETWRVEFGGANSLYRRGWRRDDLPIGKRVTVHGLPARDGSRQMEGEKVIYDSGESLFFGSSED
jgi:hypothetical protein